MAHLPTWLDKVASEKHKREVCLLVEVFSGKDVDLVHNKVSSPAPPAALETVACDPVTNKLVDVALGPRTNLAELFYRAVDDALRDAESNEDVSNRAGRRLGLVPRSCPTLKTYM